ncbi:MAG: class C sortase [Microbacterium sp.]|nr:class C sortase [Microbacterium sp.]
MRRPRRVSGLSVVIALIGLAGAALLLYPSAAAWFTQLQQSQQIDEYTDSIGALSAEHRVEEIQRAEEYNQALIGGTSVLAAGERKPQSEVDAAAHADYADLLHADDLGLMARLKIPAINVDLPIYHGTSDDVLEHGVGHLEGTALPVGGESTHAVLTGHRGLATSELFTHLDLLTMGDTFTIEVFGEVLTYRIIDTRIVAPDDTETLRPQRGNDLVTLVTCTPLGINSHRILVTGERILPTPVKDVSDAGRHPDVPGFPWWAVTFGGVVILLGVYVTVAGRRPTVPVEDRDTPGFATRPGDT